MEILRKMNRIRSLPALLLIAGLLSHILCFAETPLERRHRLYDMAPVSPANPVVASVEGTDIEIPLSEYRAYVASLPGADKRSPLSLARKRELLADLLNEHFLLWEGYRQKIDQREAVTKMLEQTKIILLESALTETEVGAKAKTPDEEDKLAKELRSRIFDKADIFVSNEAYDEVRKIIRAKNTSTQIVPAATTNGAGTLPKGYVLAKCKAGSVTIGDFLSAYTQAPVSSRPNIETQQGMVEFLKQMLEDSLMVAEARERGLEKSEAVREKMQLNRNVLTRMGVLDELSDKASAMVKKPGFEADLRRWYDDHRKSRYTYQDSTGKEQVVPFAEEHESIQNDYLENLMEQMRAEKINSLRKGQKIQINEKLLE